MSKLIVKTSKTILLDTTFSKFCHSKFVYDTGSQCLLRRVEGPKRSLFNDRVPLPRPLWNGPFNDALTTVPSYIQAGTFLAIPRQPL